MRAPQFEHPWLLTTLKGHVSDISDLDFSSNGKYLVSVSLDRSLYFWSVKASLFIVVVWFVLFIYVFSSINFKLITDIYLKDEG